MTGIMLSGQRQGKGGSPMSRAEERRQEEAKQAYDRFALKVGLLLVPVLIVGILGVVYDSEPAWFLAMVAVFGTAFALRFFDPGRPAVSRQILAGTSIAELDTPETADPLLPLGNVRLPVHAEPLHLLIEGATGTGKTQALKNMTAFLRARGDTVVAVDGGYDLHQTFGRPKDVVLSLFDERSPGWMPWNEVRSPGDWAALAQSLIGNGRGEAVQWHSMAKAMFAAIGRSYSRMLKEAGEPFDPAEFFHLLTGASGDELAPLLRGTSAASLATNDKGLGAVRMTFYETLKFWEFLRPGDFSIRGWVEKPGRRPSIFIPYPPPRAPRGPQRHQLLDRPDGLRRHRRRTLRPPNLDHHRRARRPGRDPSPPRGRHSAPQNRLPHRRRHPELRAGRGDLRTQLRRHPRQQPLQQDDLPPPPTAPPQNDSPA